MTEETKSQMQKVEVKALGNTTYTVIIESITDQIAAYLVENDYRKIVITMKNNAKVDEPADLVETLVFEKYR